MTEDERAATYRIRERLRVAWRQANARRLAGDALAARRVHQTWEPLLGWLRDRQQMEDADDGEDRGATANG